MKKPTARYIGKKLLLPISGKPTKIIASQRRRAKKLAAKVNRRTLKEGTHG